MRNGTVNADPKKAFQLKGLESIAPPLAGR
jgi:hypothetical protein